MKISGYVSDFYKKTPEFRKSAAVLDIKTARTVNEILWHKNGQFTSDIVPLYRNSQKIGYGIFDRVSDRYMTQAKINALRKDNIYDKTQ